MQNKFISFFHNHPRKESMLLSMIYTFIFVNMSFAVASLYLSQYGNLQLNITVLMLALFLLNRYYQTKNVKRIAILFLLMMELNSGIALAGNSTQNFVAIFPFIYVAGFFFFLELKEAMWAILIHIVYWLVVANVAFKLFPKGYSILPANVINDVTVVIILFFLGIFYQFTTESAYQKLRFANREKKRLLVEIHHKIKNNLNFISSILGLQKRHIKKHEEEDNYSVLIESKQRIQSIALIHQAMYNSKDSVHVDFETYVRSLVSLVNSRYKKDISLHYEMDNVLVSEVLNHRLGLILNELLNKSLKIHHEKITLYISLQKVEEGYLFSYQDENIQQDTSKKDFGDKLIDLIIQQMEADVEITFNKGVLYQVWFEDDT